MKGLQLDLFGWNRRAVRRGHAALPPAHVRTFRLPGRLRTWPVDERSYVFGQHQLTLRLGLIVLMLAFAACDGGADVAPVELDAAPCVDAGAGDADDSPTRACYDFALALGALFDRCDVGDVADGFALLPNCGRVDQVRDLDELHGACFDALDALDCAVVPSPFDFPLPAPCGGQLILGPEPDGGTP